MHVHQMHSNESSQKKMCVEGRRETEIDIAICLFAHLTRLARVRQEEQNLIFFEFLNDYLIKRFEVFYEKSSSYSNCKSNVFLFKITNKVFQIEFKVGLTCYTSDRAFVGLYSKSIYILWNKIHIRSQLSNTMLTLSSQLPRKAS